jgi:hypothetical protein
MVELQPVTSGDHIANCEQTDQSCRTSVQALKRAPEGIKRSVPGIGNRPRITDDGVQVASNHDPLGRTLESFVNCPGLSRVHHDDQVRRFYFLPRQRFGAEVRQIDFTLSSDGKRFGGDWSSPSDESGGSHCNVWKQPLQDRLQIRAAANISVTHDENAASAT